ncbi:MAG TPA: hypothetical protein VGD10_12040 [Allosphingosinicella sp.]|uniref:hypothetical protein n=1 Tax=Allosphingosinicella sp. TaxID=2823234 RepID=UPI002ED9D7A3
MNADLSELEKHLDAIDEVYLAAEALAERLEELKLYKAAAYGSMALDVIREARNRLSAQR